MNIKTGPHPTLGRLLIIALTLALLASACGGSDSDDSSGADRAGEDSSAKDLSSDSGDDESVFAGGVDADSAGDSGSDEEREEAVAEQDEDESASAGADARADAEGLFAPPESEEPDPDRLENNTFEDYGIRGFVDAQSDPLSTFALDVDTGSFTVGRRWLDEGVLPPSESVRVEEYVNAFSYDYDDRRRGLEISVDGGPSPFDRDNILVRVGIQGAIVDEDDRESASIVFVVDTSGSMDRDDRLGLVKESLAVLVDGLNDDDTVAIVTYDSNAGTVLEPTAVRHRDEILDAIDRLDPGGSTNLEAGLRSGYDLARQAFVDGGVNRVVLASDGVANVGVTDPHELSRMIRDDADRGIQLVTVGYGMGNFNDETMEQLADEGDGFYAYIDTSDEAERFFEDELAAVLVSIAKDAKIQVEFNEDVVESYRLLGFENRGIRDSDFRDDSVDAGELGSGHQVTALYEIELQRGVDLDDRDEIGVVSLRWEDPESGDVEEIDEDIDLRDVEPDWNDTDDDFQLAVVVASFAELLRGSPHADEVDLEDLAAEADRLAGDHDTQATDELAELIERALTLSS
ncbi:MAG: VWA domain-containing protein [Actinomycetia bacterium]|nr:VWA domain-containing protein [Actinomycetes bacterium]